MAALQIELQSCRDEVVRLSDLLADQALQLQHGHGAAAAAAHARHSEQQELRSGLAAAHALAAEYAAHAARAGEALRRLLVRAGLRQTAWEAAVRAEPCDGGGGGGGGGGGKGGFDFAAGAPPPVRVTWGERGAAPGAREIAWIGAAEEELGRWMDELMHRQAEVERRLQGAETARLTAQADALATHGRESARVERADSRSRTLADSVHGAQGRDARGEASAFGGLVRLRASEGAAQCFQRGERGAWERRAHAAEAHNERVAGLLGKYVVRNQLRVPSMPASILGAQQASELRAISQISGTPSAR